MGNSVALLEYSVVDSDLVAGVSETRFNKLGDQVSSLAERVAKAESSGSTHGAVKTLIAVAISLIGFLLLEVYQHNARLGVVETKLDRIQEELKFVVQSSPSAKLVKLADEPNEENLRDVRHLINQAKADREILPKEAIRSAAARLLDASFPERELSQEAWDATVELADYYSFLIGIQEPAKPLSDPKQGKAPLPKGIVVHMLRGGIIGGTQPLDGVMWEDVVFRNVHVTYKGGPVILKNVRFENCTFALPVSPPGRTVVWALFQTKIDVEIVG